MANLITPHCVPVLLAGNAGEPHPVVQVAGESPSTLPPKAPPPFTPRPLRARGPGGCPYSPPYPTILTCIPVCA